MVATRRGLFGILLGGACACCAPRAAEAGIAASEKVIRFCAKAGAPKVSSTIPLDEYQDPIVRDYLANERDRLVSFFDVPQARFLIAPGHDSAEMNSSLDRRRIDVIVGSKFIEDTGARKYGMLQIASAVGHEFGHAFQVKWKVDDSLKGAKGYNVKAIELHADYLCGAFLGARNFRSTAAAEVATMFHGLGDNWIQSQQHHGKENERFLAFSQGWSDAKEEFRSLGADARMENIDVKTLATKGLLHVSQYQ